MRDIITLTVLVANGYQSYLEISQLELHHSQPFVIGDSLREGGREGGREKGEKEGWRETDFLYVLSPYPLPPPSLLPPSLPHPSLLTSQAEETG